MFWGLILEPRSLYTQVVEHAFHISMAALDISNSNEEPSQVMCTYKGRNYLLCTLQKPDKLQCSLDLYFEEGTEVSFAANGKSHVHLTGYLTKDVDDALPEDEEDDEEVEEEEEVKSKKKKLKEPKGPSPKKSKISEFLLNATTEDEDDEDSDVDMEKLLQGSDDDDDDEVEEEENDEEDEEIAEEESDEEDESDQVDSSDAEDDESVEEEEEIEKNVNGLKKSSKVAKPGSTPKGKAKESRDATPFHKGKKENGLQTKQAKETNENDKKKAPLVNKKKVLPSGVIIEDLKEGQGNAVSNGKFVHVYYEGRLKQNNKVFDKTQKGNGFGFRLGKGEVIKGWDIGVNGMKVGGKRRITCPPHLAYGAKGSPPVIPPNSTLVFEVELKKVN